MNIVIRPVGRDFVQIKSYHINSENDTTVCVSNSTELFQLSFYNVLYLTEF